MCQVLSKVSILGVISGSTPNKTESVAGSSPKGKSECSDHTIKCSDGGQEKQQRSEKLKEGEETE